MKNGHLKSFREKVAETETFKKWSPVVKKISMTRNNLCKIEHGMTVATNIGFKKWERQTDSHPRNVELIKELLGQS